MNAEEIIREFPKGILNWYQFHKNGKALLITENESVLAELLTERCKGVDQITPEQGMREAFLQKGKGCYDYVIAIGVLEKLKKPSEALCRWKNLLNGSGRMLLGADNRLGLRYFCGDRDPYTGRSFDGVENYHNVLALDRDEMKGRAYSREELKTFLNEAGLTQRKFYSVLPNLEAPQLLYAEDYIPKEELGVRYFPMYHYPESVFLQEEYLYTDLIKNGMFHLMANSYLIECSMDGSFDTAEHVTVSLDRGRENAMATVIEKTGGQGRKVRKCTLYPEGGKKLEVLQENANDLRNHGIYVVESQIRDGAYIMPYVESEIALQFLRNLARTDTERFIAEMDRFRDLILQSSEHMESDKELGIILKRGYLDLVPLNCFYDDGRYLFYDQEFIEENCPANVLIYRVVTLVYMNKMDQEMEYVLPVQFFMERYGLTEHLDYWKRRANEFVEKLRYIKELRIFSEKNRPSPQIVNSNRQKINYSQTDYQKLFIDIFRNIDGKKIVLFGSGVFAKRFLIQFKNDYQVSLIVDNNSSRWGKHMEGIEIKAPKLLTEIPPEELRVIICVKNYTGIVRQLEKMGIQDYCIYDYNIDYPRRQITNPAVVHGNGNPAEERKKYHTGYIAGVFDLFHIGHLNMFKRAKEQCDYLIVGVVSDEGVRVNKKTEPFVPFIERIEMVRSCRYVDEAVEIPFSFGGTKDAYRMYHFDCQFSGSDYVDDPCWLAEKMFLEKNGAEMVFFPYTESTSSTKLKKLISEKLL